MLVLVVKTTPDCEGLITYLPRFHEWDLQSEEYDDDGVGTITIIAHDIFDPTAAIVDALESHPGVIEYDVNP